MILNILPSTFTVCKVASYPMDILQRENVFIGKTPYENSLVCPTEIAPKDATEREDGWRGFFIEGNLDFSLIGILAEISDALAKEKIGILAISTYDTDYVFVKKENLSAALAALTKVGYDCR